MTVWKLNYLFYVGIILPTIVTLALFVFFVICWRKQSARKAVLTKPYDPHGTMRRLGIPNRPPPPPVFLHSRLSSPTTESFGGEDNAAYDMSRSPSAEANAGGHTAAGHLPHHLQFRHSPSGETNIGGSGAGQQRLQFHVSPSGGELDIAGRLAFHSRLDSGLSEPACDSPGASSGGGGGGGGAGGGAGPRDRPQSQASHSSHSTDSEDSGFRSSRSGQFVQNGHHEPPVLRRSRSAGRGKGRGFYHKAATSSPESDSEPSLQLTPTALWPHHHAHLGHPYPHQHSLQDGEGTAVKSGEVDLNDIGTHLGWKYLQDLTSPGHRARERPGTGVMTSPGHRQTLTCHQSMTLAQVHTSHDLDNPDVFGFSVV